MKRLFSIITASFALQFFVLAQCPNPALTTPGFHPPADQLPPIERGVLYDEDVQINIPASFDTTVPPIGQITVTINNIHVDNIAGAPSGISYTCTPSTCDFPGGSAGCINFSGTTNDPAGQYPLSITVTATVTIPILGQQTQTFDLSTLGFSYYLTVTDPGALAVSVSANPASVCAGSSSTLTATVINGSGSETFAWSNGGTTNPVTVTPGVTTTYSVTVTDGGNTATGSAIVTVNQLPTADFSVTTNDATVTVINENTGATSFSINYGDGTAAGTSLTHTYTANGTYTITMTATNSCGSDTYTEDVNITGVFISLVKNNLQFNVYPNPSSGIFTVSLTFTGKPLSLKIYDVSGKAVYKETITETSRAVKKQLDMSSFPKGVYTLHLNSEDGNGIQRLTIF
ncbi:MAG TPA: T9SS type A sorting domain-containing protein [Chitinophagales bacterium]|nr:T9SS type A sorting domain-containing protein [Chitinophagales bacterium]